MFNLLLTYFFTLTPVCQHVYLYKKRTVAGPPFRGPWTTGLSLPQPLTGLALGAVLRLHARLDMTEQDIMPPPLSSEDSNEPVEDQSPPARPHRPRAADVEDALTQIVATLQGLQQQQRDLAQQQHVVPQARHQDVPEDPAFDWNRLRLPSTTSFPVPCTARVQRMAGELQARLRTLAGRDQKEAMFVLNMTADWPGLNDEGRTVVYQRLYLHALVAAYGWPTDLYINTEFSSTTQSIA